MATRTASDPRDRILDAAEKVIGEFGFAGASLRDIVLEARVNLATVYYYFHSKTGLVEEVLKRRFGPLRQEHLELLRRFEAEANGDPLPVARILEAMLLPPLCFTLKAPAKQQAVMRLLGRIVTEPSPEIQEVLHTQRAEVRTAFLKAFQRALPQARPPDLLWRMEFVWGALASTLCNPGKIAFETRGACNPARTDELLAEMIHFFSAGFRALERPPRKR